MIIFNSNFSPSMRRKSTARQFLLDDIIISTLILISLPFDVSHLFTSASATTTVPLSAIYRRTGVKKLLSEIKFSGLVAVSGIGASYSSARIILDTLLPACLEAASERFEVPLSDGGSRITIAQDSNDHFSVGLESCSQEVREAAGIVKKALADTALKVIGLISASAASVNVTYSDTSAEDHSLASIAQRGVHLDHFHLYKANQASLIHSSPSVHMHTDRGLLLAITPTRDSALFGPQGSISVEHPEDSVLIMVGAGLTSWLGFPGVTAAPHAVKMATPNRVVVARMVMPARGAVSSHGGSFEEFFRHREVAARVPPAPADAERAEWRRLQGDACGANEKMCWMQCMHTSECSVDEALCWNTATNSTCSPSGHDYDCALKCFGTDPAAPPSAFCNGRSSMYMTGFAWTGGGSTPCVILFFHGWALDTPGKFRLGCAGVFCLGLLVEWLVEWLVHLRRLLARERPASRQQRVRREAAAAALFGLNIAAAYLAMLVAMTYSVQLFLLVCLGLVAGHFLFNRRAPVAESADPCCVSAMRPGAPSAVATPTAQDEELPGEDRAGARHFPSHCEAD